MAEQGWRERKKELTRKALVEAGLRLFEEHGYAETSIARIAAEAGIAPRTFFSYFAGKEDLVFADTPDRLAIALAAMERRAPEDTVADVLERVAADTFGDALGGTDPLGLSGARMRLVTAVPALRAAALDRLWAAERTMAEGLARAFPGELDEDTAAMLVGSVVGAYLGAAGAALRRGEGPEAVRRAVHAAIGYAVQAARTVPLPGHGTPPARR
ncbi:TetR/AcrR family transcriptional regulator [Nocardiopsis composta]|uniref:AcrR family transcriptional regulator n=1 Tax=Nocardiopsis composta TaxID=157465 RepID=A0A7W8VCH8_9ACTN|nr:TetR/AcrR family transcriptional regulator [Nocardiopsis composta]MBB5430943.1 AcrR family transcriptional regulator [Nocardiopsis composta]